MAESKLSESCNKEFDNLIADLKDIISIKSVSKKDTDGLPFGKGCKDVLDLFLKKASDMGFLTKNIDNYAGTISFDERKPKLGILCHLDVVDAEKDEGWTSDPFEPEIRNGRLYGRGAIDDKGPAMAVLYAMKIIKDSGIKLKRNVKFIVGCDEENGSSDMEYYRTKEDFPPMCFTPDGNYPCINFEKGMIRARFSHKLESDDFTAIKGGKVINAVPNYASVTTKEGGEIAVLGTAAHASTPWLGENALTKLVQKIVEGKLSKDETWTKLSKLFPHREYNGKSLGIASHDKKTGDVTCIWSRVEIIDGILYGDIDIRFPMSISLEEIKNHLKKRFEQNGFNVDIVMAENYHYVPEDSEFVQKLLKVYSDETGEDAKPLAIGGGTYVHDIEGGVAFGAEFPGENNNMHSPDESIKLESLMKNLRMFVSAIVSLCC